MSNPNAYTKAAYPYEVFYQRQVGRKVVSGSVPIASKAEAEACVRGMKRSPDLIEAFIRKRNPRRKQSAGVRWTSRHSDATLSTKLYPTKSVAEKTAAQLQANDEDWTYKVKEIPSTGMWRVEIYDEDGQWVANYSPDAARNPRAGFDNQGVYLAGAKQRIEREKAEYEAGSKMASALFAEAIKTVPLADWTKVEGQEVLRSGSSRFVGVPRNGKRSAASFDVIDLDARKLVCTLKKDEVYTWLWRSAEAEHEGILNPSRPVRNPYLHKFIPPGGKGYQYVYSEEDVAKRHAKKAQRIEQLKAKEEALRRGVKRDVAAGDPTALAVGLIMTTYERPGNETSAKAGHYGVTGWQCRHLTTTGRKATIDYVAKSGVHQTKEITDAYLVRALVARQRKCGRKGDKLIPTTASAVNRYLDSYDISAKDLRTFGANTEMKRELTRVRAAGPNIRTLSARDLKKTLKAEFNAALAVVASKLGHTTSVLRKQYLVQGIEPMYLETGKILQTFA